MTATDYPSLDALLTTTPPTEPAPFDLAVILRQHRYAVGEIPNAAQWAITRYVNGLRVDTEKARALVVQLENENAELRDEYPHHIESTANPLHCIKCGEPWICMGSIEEDIAAAEPEPDSLAERVIQVVALLTEALTWHSSETDNTACAVQDALALLTEGDAS